MYQFDYEAKREAKMANVKRVASDDCIVVNIRFLFVCEAVTE